MLHTNFLTTKSRVLQLATVINPLRRGFHLVVAVFLISTALFSCSKTNNTEVADENLVPSSVTTSTKTVTGNTTTNAVVAAPIILTVTTNSNLNANKGGSFSYTLKVTQGGVVKSGYSVGIDDPFKSQCLSIATNSAGVINYTTTASTLAVEKFYDLRFYIANATPIISTVAINATGTLKKLPNTSLTLSTTTQSNNTNILLLSERAFSSGGLAPYTATVNNSFGKDLYNEVVGSWYNVGVVTVVAVSCSATPFFPPAGAVCVVSARATAAIVAEATVKTILKTAIDNTSNLTATQRTNAKLFVDGAGLIWGIAHFKIDRSFQLLSAANAVNTSWNLGSASAQLYFNNVGAIKGIHLTGALTNTANAGDLCSIAVMKR